MRLNVSESSNPVISRVRNEHTHSASYVVGETATFTGIATKTGILLAIIFAISSLIWTNFDKFGNAFFALFFISSFAGFIFVLLAQFTRAKALFTILYAVSEGFIIGTLTYIVKTLFADGTGLVINAVAITFAVLAFLLVVYATGIFKVGFGFRKMVFTIMIGLMFGYLILGILSLFGISIFGYNPAVTLILSLIMVVLAAFNLLIDFDDCKRAVNGGLPKQYEWVLSLGLLVSLVWLFIETLRILIIIASRVKDD